MFFTSETTRITVCAEVRPHFQAEHSSDFIVQCLEVCLAVSEFLQVWLCEEISVIGIAPAFRQTVGPSSVFHVEAVCGCLGGIVHTAPVADYHAVKSPFSFEDIVQEVLVMAAMLVLVLVV